MISKREVSLDLILKCEAKNPVAQKELYLTLLPMMNALCRRYLWDKNDLKDALQESFIAIFKNLKQYDVNKASFKTWSSRIAINTCIYLNKQNKRRASEELIINLHEPVINPEVIDNLSSEEVLNYLKQMPFPYLQVFNLFILDGFSHQEIAEMLEIKVTLSRKRLARAKEWIQKTITDKNDFGKKYIYRN